MLWKFMFYNFEEKKSSVFNQNLIFCNFDHLGCFRSVGNRWFWYGRRGETRFPLPLLLWRLWHRVFVFSSWRWTFLWIKSHGRSLFFLISDFHFLTCFLYVWNHVETTVPPRFFLHPKEYHSLRLPWFFNMIHHGSIHTVRTLLRLKYK